MMYIVFLGPPGSGKGTQTTVLVERKGLARIATGDLLRDAVREDTDLGKKARDYMNRGELVPDDLVVSMVVDRLSRPDVAGGAVLDGFPRNIQQAKALRDALGQRAVGVDLVVYLQVSEPALVARLAARWECPSCRVPYHEVVNSPAVAGRCDRCGTALVQRPDDRPETVLRRLRVYMEQTEPLLEYYRAEGILAEVDGEQSIATIAQEVLSLVDSKEMQKAGG